MAIEAASTSTLLAQGPPPGDEDDDEDLDIIDEGKTLGAEVREAMGSPEGGGPCSLLS